MKIYDSSDVIVRFKKKEEETEKPKYFKKR